MKFDENFIKSYIDRDYLNEERKARRKKTNEFFTPYSIIKRMGDKIPEKDWSDPNKTFLEPCAGNGNFVLYIIYNRLCHGIDIEQILKTLYTVELMPDNVAEMKEHILNMLNKLSIDIDVNKFNKITNKHFICNNFFRWNCIEWREKTEDEIKFEIKKKKNIKNKPKKNYITNLTSTISWK